MSGADLIIRASKGSTCPYLGEVGDAQSGNIALDLGVLVALGILEAIDDWGGGTECGIGTGCGGVAGGKAQLTLPQFH